VVVTIVFAMSDGRLTAISLFTSGGIGDLALRDAGFQILVSNEKLPDRHAVFHYNFPEAVAITGDIWKKVDKIEEATREQLAGDRLTVFYATPPCQGMSKNGRGKLLSAIRAGRKPPLDERNRLIIPTIELAKRLQPELVIFENVPEMAATIIVTESGEAFNIIDFIRQELGSSYHGTADVVEFANYGVPQCRQRLITIFSRSPRMRKWLEDHGSFLPPHTHSQKGGDGSKRWVTVRDAIDGLPILDASCKERARSEIPYHRVPLLDRMKYWWVENTPAERSAFDNQCVKCGCGENPTHTAKRDESGINRASRKTPVYCIKCGALLPRPNVKKGSEFILMKGYTSAYKRMSFDRPASALTRNLSYACSDNKLHPTQNRVLSLFEAFRIHTVDQFRYEWKRKDGRAVSDKTIREIIGESIPPAGFKAIIDHIVKIYKGEAQAVAFPELLFAGTPTGILSPAFR
jgi:DNA (cytosine-5)-methyltransferase 1